MGRRPTGRKDRYAGKHVTFVDESSDVIKSLKMAANNALRASGKIYARALADAAPKHTGALKNAAGYRLKPLRDGTPRLEVGFYSKSYGRRKGLRNYFANPAWLEFGTKPHTIEAGKHRGNTGKRSLANGSLNFMYGRKVAHRGQVAKPFIKNTVMSSVSEAKAAQEQWLKKLSGDIATLLNMPDVDDPKYDATTPEDRTGIRAWVNEQRGGSP